MPLVTRDPSNPGAADHTLYQLQIMFQESTKYKSMQLKSLAMIIRARNADADAFKSLYETL